MVKGIGLFVLLFGFFAQAELIEKRYAGNSSKETPTSAREDIYNQAIKWVTQDMVKDQLGSDIYNQNKSLIEKQIVGSYARFIPYMKAENLVGEPGKYSMTVQLKTSSDDLLKLLRENNLTASTEDLPIMMPLVRFTDSLESVQYSWWTDRYSEAPALFVQLQSRLEDSLASKMKSAHFYSLKPESLKLKTSVPQAFRVENPRIDDNINLALMYKAKLLMAGDIDIKKDSAGEKLHIRWKGVNTANGRTVADLNRVFKIENYSNKAELLQEVGQIVSDLSADFANQVELGWQRGTLDTNVIRLVIQGGLPLSQFAAFKKAVKEKSSSVKELKERLLTDKQTVFEADISGSSESLAQALKEIKLEAFSLKLANLDQKSSTLTFEVSR